MTVFFCSGWSHTGLGNTYLCQYPGLLEINSASTEGRSIFLKKTILSLLAAAVICTAQPTGASASTPAFKSEIKSQASKVMGTPYVMGGTSTRGFDCSGFTRYVYKKMHKTLPRTARQQAHIGKAVYKGNLSIGDLVFFNTLGYGISHVGIYIGNNKFIHAASSSGVTVSSLSESYYKKRYVTARRVVN